MKIQLLIQKLVDIEKVGESFLGSPTPFIMKKHYNKPNNIEPNNIVKAFLKKQMPTEEDYNFIINLITNNLNELSKSSYNKGYEDGISKEKLTYK